MKTVSVSGKIGIAIFLLVLCVSAAFGDSVQKAPTHKRSKKVAEAPLPPYTPHALSPLPLEQMPSVPPQVSYTSGKLTIVAHNSTLSDILRAVHTQTGAELEIPSNASERVVATLGPGPARDVLATLLNGTHFNYVMLGSPADPTSIERVVLTAKTGPETTTTASAAPAAPQPGMPPNRFQQPMVAAQGDNAEQDAAAEDATADQQDETTADTPDEQQGDQQQPNGQQPPKTPEQLLQELQRQQQQLQQQQQGQPGQPVQPGQPQMVSPIQPQPEN